MAASHSDSYVLSTDSTFTNRVRAALIAAAIAIWNEAANIAFHTQRVRYAAQIMNAPSNYAPLFASAVATDATACQTRLRLEPWPLLRRTSPRRPR